MKWFYKYLFIIIGIVFSINLRVKNDYEVGTDFQILLRYGLILICVPIIILNLRSSLKVKKELVLYLMFALVSIFWTNNQFITAGYVCGIIIMSYFINGLYKNLNQHGLPAVEIIIKYLSQIFLSVILLAIIVAIIYPEYGIWRNGWQNFRLGGHLIHANTLGFLSSVLIGLIILKKPFIKYNSIYLLIAGISLLLTQSRGSLIALIVSLLIVNFNRSNIKKMVFTVILCVILFSTYNQVIVEIFERGQDVTTLTGRIYIWAEMYELIKRQPYIGYGYGAMREGFYVGYKFIVSHPHNVFIALLYQLGLLGLLLNIYLLIELFKKIGYIEEKFKKVVSFLLFYLITYGITDVSYATQFNPAVLIFLIIITLTHNYFKYQCQQVNRSKLAA